MILDRIIFYLFFFYRKMRPMKEKEISVKNLDNSTKMYIIEQDVFIFRKINYCTRNVRFVKMIQTINWHLYC